jgi:hypothetical protein
VFSYLTVPSRPHKITSKFFRSRSRLKNPGRIRDRSGTDPLSGSIPMSILLLASWELKDSRIGTWNVRLPHYSQIVLAFPALAQHDGSFPRVRSGGIFCRDQPLNFFCVKTIFLLGRYATTLGTYNVVT